MVEQLEAHGLYVIFIAGVLLVVLMMAVESIAEARRDRVRRAKLDELTRVAGNIERGLAAARNQGARWQG